MRPAKELSEDYWHAFVTRHLVNYLRSLGEDDILTDPQALIDQQEDIATMPPKDANKILRQYISEPALKTFSTRFRADKYRKTRKKKTLQLQENTHKRLLALKALLNADTVDEVLDYAMSKRYENDYDIIEAKEKLGESVSDIAHFNFNGLLNRLTLDDKYKLYYVVKTVYADAWKMRKKARSDKEEVLNQSMLDHQFMKIMMEDDALRNGIEFKEYIE